MTAIDDAPAAAAADPWRTPERVALRRLARDVVAREIAPHMAEWEQAGELPRELHTRVARAGLLGVGFPEEVGGSGGNPIDSAIVTEEILLGGGIPGVLLLMAALWLIARDGWRVWRTTASDSAVVMGRAAFIALVQLSLASAFDYPLRTSLMAVFAAFLVFWLRRGALAAVPASAGSRSAPNSR